VCGGSEGAERLGVVGSGREEPPGGGGFFWLWLTRQTYCYILMVRGSVSLKLRVDSAGRTISFSPV
jgi:hypothetical protein